ncbi:MAG: protein kinase [Polyangiales bacterium]
MVLNSELPKRGDVIAGKYEITGVLGAGGMGAVYQATHRVTGKAFAIKWLLPQLTAESDHVQRFIREAQVAGRVDHPNVVEVYDVGQEVSSFYMVMELLQGESLAQRITNQTKLSAIETCQIMIPVTRGLVAAHEAGVIHRDLKPDNIFLSQTQDGHEVPKVLDFGISKMSALGSEGSSGLTRHGTLMGTPHYMAPEQVRGHQVDQRTDIYALGVILYQMLTGQLPFPGEGFSDIILKIVTETPPPIASLAPKTPPQLIQIVEWAMARDPAQRPESAQELGRALEPFASGLRYDTKAVRYPTGSNELRLPKPKSQTPLATETPVREPEPELNWARGSGGASIWTRGGLIASVAVLVVAVSGLGVFLGTLHPEETTTTHSAAHSGTAPSKAPPEAPVGQPREVMRTFPQPQNTQDTQELDDPRPLPNSPSERGDNTQPRFDDERNNMGRYDGDRSRDGFGDNSGTRDGQDFFGDAPTHKPREHNGATTAGPRRGKHVVGRGKRGRDDEGGDEESQPREAPTKKSQRVFRSQELTPDDF